jgi:hypothetical protein
MLLLNVVQTLVFYFALDTDDTCHYHTGALALDFLFCALSVLGMDWTRALSGLHDILKLSLRDYQFIACHNDCCDEVPKTWLTSVQVTLAATDPRNEKGTLVAAPRRSSLGSVSVKPDVQHPFRERKQVKRDAAATAAAAQSLTSPVGLHVSRDRGLERKLVVPPNRRAWAR